MIVQPGGVLEVEEEEQKPKIEVKKEKERHETHDEHASHGLDCPSKRVRGKVVGLDGKETIPLIGASLHWLGTTEGVVSDMEGNFSIRPSEHTHNLVISYVGYKSDTLHLHHGANVQITLFPEMMDELESDEANAEYRRFFKEHFNFN